MSATTLDRRALDTRAPAPLSYDRISRFRVNRDGIDTTVTRAPDRQWRDNRDCSVMLGLGEIPATARFSDRDRSASQFAKREREAFNAMLDAIRSGRYTHALVWLFDRAFRTTEAAEQFLAACREGGALIVQTAGSPIIADPHNPDDIFRLKLAGLLAEYEVAKLSMRSRRRKVADAAAGMPNGGRRRFGYGRDWITVDETEAAVLRDIAGRVLGGESLTSITRWLNREGVPTVGQGDAWARGDFVSAYRWYPPSVRQMLLNPAYAGRRMHNGVHVADAAWPAILDDATHEALVRKLTHPSRRKQTGTARRYLLTNIAVCDACGLPLKGRPSSGGNASYSCKSDRHCFRAVKPVDDVVEAIVIERLSRLNMAGALVDDSVEDDARALRESRRAVEVALDELDEDRASGAISRDRYNRAAAKLEARRDALDAELGAVSDRATNPLATLAGFVLDDDGATREQRRAYALAAWEAAELGRRRELVSLLCASIRLVGGKRVFKPSQVRVTLRA